MGRVITRVRGAAGLLREVWELACELGVRWSMQLVGVILVLGAARPLLVLIRIIPKRLVYPGELEWMEGGMLAHVVRVLSSQPLYVLPSVDFTPFIYPPLYVWLSAAVAASSSPSLFALRLVSAISTVGSLIAIVAFAWHRHRSWLAGWVGAGFFAATFRIGGAWFDVARVDSLFVFLLLVGVHAWLNYRSRNGAIVAACCLSAACLTKQSGCATLAILFAYSLFTFDRWRLWSTSLAGAVTAGAFMILSWTSHGWFRYYAFKLASHHPLLPDMFVEFFKRDMFGTLGIASLMTLYAALTSMYQPRRSERPSAFALVILALVLPAWLARIHSGQYDNVLMPMHAALALGVAEAVARAREQRVLFATFACGLLVTLWTLKFQERDQLPTTIHTQRLAQARAAIAELPRKTWIVAQQGLTGPEHGLVGAHGMAMFDVLRDNKDAIAFETRRSIEQGLADHRFDAIVVPGCLGTFSFVCNRLGRHYRLSHGMEGPHMLTGWDLHSIEIWLPRAPGKR